MGIDLGGTIQLQFNLTSQKLFLNPLVRPPLVDMKLQQISHRLKDTFYLNLFCLHRCEIKATATQHLDVSIFQVFQLPSESILREMPTNQIAADIFKKLKNSTHDVRCLLLLVCVSISLYYYQSIYF